ncbi:hypothetical protein RvY_18316 [Ramazzottius varieornatus]|uniref:Uncharacterized protein n=1 Tax=Ramazzottius varieornatus TaxID=947166 RepID=A0A1D1WAA0_RAMVA|nr:hypothetical protein RvY_18316 [Ramazzottius varieornatus]
MQTGTAATPQNHSEKVLAMPTNFGKSASVHSEVTFGLEAKYVLAFSHGGEGKFESSNFWIRCPITQ